MLDKLKSIGSHFITGLIVVNFVVTALSTYPFFDRYAAALELFDQISLAIYCVEMVLRLVFGGKSFWLGPDKVWNLFDLGITVISVIAVSPAFAVIRSLRVLRLLRVISSFGKLRQLIVAIGKTLPSILWLFVLMVVFYAIYTVFGTISFGQAFPEYFGSLQATAFSLFQVMTLESWSMDIARPVIQVYPWSWAYFVSYILITSYIVMNAVAGVLVGGMTSEATDESLRNQREMKAQLAALKAQIENLQRTLDSSRNPPKGR